MTLYCNKTFAVQVTIGCPSTRKGCVFGFDVWKAVDITRDCLMCAATICPKSLGWKSRQLKNVSQRSTKKQKVVVIEVAFNAHALDSIINFRVTEHGQRSAQ